MVISPRVIAGTSSAYLLIFWRLCLGLKGNFLVAAGVSMDAFAVALSATGFEQIEI